MKRLVLAFTFVVATLASAQAQSYPSRPIKVIVPFAPGGVTDVLARVWAQRMSQSLGQNVFVENHGGGGSNIGMGLAARQPADGHTVLLAASSFTINPSLYNKIPYDPFKDFSPITLFASTKNVLVVHPSLPASNVNELIDLVRANPGKYSYAMSGAGTPNHIQAETLKRAHRLDLTMVPFSGGGPAIQSTVAGHTPVAFTSLAPVQALVAGEKLRALGVSGVTRAAVWPTVPTMAERGIKGQEADVFTGLLVPAGTPKEIVDRLHAETVKILAQADVKEQFEKLGFEAGGMTPEQFAARLRDEVAAWGKAIDEAQIAKQ